MFPYVLMLVVIAVRPQGLFGRTLWGTSCEHRDDAVTKARQRDGVRGHGCRRARPPCGATPTRGCLIFVGFMIAVAVHPEPWATTSC